MKKILLLLSVFAFVTFSACKKEKLKKDEYEKEGEKDWDKKEKDLCFDLVYPVTYTMPDGIAISGSDEESIWKSIKDWYESNPESKEKPVLEYPVNVIYKDWDDDEEDEDWTKTIANEEEMTIAKKNCYEKEKEGCFKLVYPITFLMPDGASLTLSNEEGEEALKDWYESNPDIEEKPELQYPVNILYSDWDEEGNSEGTIVTVGDEEEMIGIKKDCYEDKEPCFELVYPIIYTMPDGASLTLSNEEGEEALKAWYEANPGIEEKPELQYPITISFDDGTIQSITNEEEMILAKEDCYEADEDE